VNEKHVDTAIRKALDLSAAEQGKACPDPELLAAYLEHRLAGVEKEAFEAHAGDCESCRRALALAMTIDEESASGAPLPSSSPKKLLFRISIPVSAVALLLLAVAAGVLFLRTSTPPAQQSTTEISELRSQEPKAPAAPAAAPRDASSVVRLADKQPLAPKGGAPVRIKETAKPKDSESEMHDFARAPAASRPSVAEVTDSGAKRDAGLPSVPRADYAAVRSENALADRTVQAKDVAGGIVGVGGIAGIAAEVPRAASVQKMALLNMAPGESSLRDAVVESGRQKGDADASRWKKIGDRGFRFASGYWVDEQCSRNPKAPVVETREGAPDFEEILRLYPDLRTLRPALIFWKEKIFVFR